MSFDIVDKLNKDFERNYNTGQVKEAVTCYANDARLFADDKQIYEGLNQIEKYFFDARAAGNTKVDLHTGKIIQCGSDYLIETRFSYHQNTFSYIHFFFSI
jgi:ketosteroid isomerase-like protein